MRRTKIKTALFIGPGQIGKATLKRFLSMKPKVVVIHSLTEQESIECVKLFESENPYTRFIVSFGNIFLPYQFKDLSTVELHSKAAELINYFYSDITEDNIKKSTIYQLISIYKPDIIVDSVNSATVLGESWNLRKRKCNYQSNPQDSCHRILLDDFTTKIVHFVFGLKYAIEKFSVERYVKISTTGLGGMGLNMPYTHGDNSQLFLSCALIGKISASGILHQLLWNLSHTPGFNISLVIPGTFVGYDTVKDETIDNCFGLVRKCSNYIKYPLEFGKILEYSKDTKEDFLHFPVVRAGENHVYSREELKVLTAVGQMEAITKEEVATAAMNCILGDTRNDIFVAMDKALLQPTFCGNIMVNKVIQRFNSFPSIHGIATGNLGVLTAKQLYELYCIKRAAPMLSDLTKQSLVQDVNRILYNDNDLLCEITSLGLPIIFDSEEIVIGRNSLYPEKDDDKQITKENIEQWRTLGWVDLSSKSISKWILVLKELGGMQEKKHMDNYSMPISEDYDIGAVLAYYYNSRIKGRKRMEI